jgi:hypothetical protein
LGLTEARRHGIAEAHVVEVEVLLPRLRLAQHVHLHVHLHVHVAKWLGGPG